MAQISFQVNLVINPQPAALTAVSNPFNLPTAVVGSPVTDEVGSNVTGGVPPYTFSLAPGSTLPAGLSMDSSGNITGTPTQPGNAAFSVNVVDSGS